MPELTKEIKEMLIEEFGLSRNNIKSNNETTINSCQEFMRRVPKYEVTLNSKSSLSSLFKEKELDIPPNIKVDNIGCILDDFYYYIKCIDENIIYFKDLINLQFLSTRRENDELVDGTKNIDENKTIAAVIAPIRKAVFLQKEEGLLEPFDEVTLDTATMYNFDSFSTIEHLNGNHRLYGCMLFAPYLEKFHVEFKGVKKYYPNNKFNLEINNLKRIIKKLSIFDMKIKITLQKESLNTLNKDNKKIFATLSIYSKYDDSQPLFRLFKMSLEDISESLNESAIKVIEMLNEISKSKKIKIYAHNMNSYVFDSKNNNVKYSIENIKNKLTPISERIFNSLKNIF